ncbi:MAG: PAS domain S-box protein [Syntrophobacteraceae bacterium]|nr:PAS domain S-box protein [Syntrophobacteraceae bacterium]
MVSSYIRQEKFDELRRRVEEILGNRNEQSQDPSGLDVTRLIHELEARQVELENRNEELRTAKNDLQESISLYGDLYEHAPVGYLDLSLDGLIARANSAARKRLGIISHLPPDLSFHAFIHTGDLGKFRALMRRVGKGEEEKGTCGLRIVCKDQAEAIIQLELSPARDEERKVKGWRLVFVDMTERKRAEQKVVERKEHLRAELKAMARLQKISSMCATDGAMGTVLGEIVDAAVAISGADFGAIQLFDGKTSMLSVVAQQGFPQWWTDSWNMACKGRGACCTVVKRRKRTVIQNVEESPVFIGTPARDIMVRAGVKTVQCTPLLSRSGVLVGVFSTHYKVQKRLEERTLRLLDMFGRHAADIIERAQLVEELRRREERLRALVQASSDAIYRISPDWKEIRRIYGFDVILGAESQGGYWLKNCIHPDDQMAMLAKINESMRTKSILEHEYRFSRADGSFGWRFARAIPLLDENGKILEWFGAASDITQHKQAENALRESEERFRALVQASSDVIYQMSPDWKEVRRVFGRDHIVDMESIGGGNWFQKHIPPEDHPAMLAKIGECIRSDSIFEHEHRVLRLDGSPGWVFSRAIPLKDANGKLLGWFGAASDITQRKQAENSLRESEERFRVAQELSPDGFTIFRPVRDAAGNVTDFDWVYENPAIARMTGSDPKEIVGRRLLDILPGYRASSFFKAYRHVAQTGETLVLEDLYGGDSVLKPTWFRVAVVRMGGDIAILTQDISARKKMEEELRRSQEELEKRVRERTASLEAANEKLRLVPSKLIEVQENESKRLASDLHDSIGQTLAALKFRIEHVSTVVRDGKAKEADRLLGEFVPIIQRSIDETRMISMGLKPTVLSEQGLLAALEWYRRQLLAVYSKIHIEFETAIQEEDIPEALKIAMFRIAQEALNNSCKHSGAEWIDVRVALNEGNIELVISDDGIGMDVGYILKSTAAKSLGLIGMKERAEIFGGKLYIESALEEGARVRAVWPATEDARSL